MFPVCSCSSQSQIPLQAALRPFSPLRRVVNIRGSNTYNVILGLSNGNHFQELYFNTEARKFLSSNAIQRRVTGVTKFTNILTYSDGLDGTNLPFSNKLSDSARTTSEPYTIGKEDLYYVENSSTSTPDDELLTIPDQVAENTTILPEPSVPDTVSTIDARVDILPENSSSTSDSLNLAGDELYKLKSRILEFLSDISASIGNSVDKGERAVNNTLDVITSSVKYAIQNTTETIDNAVSNVLPTIDRTGELSGNGLGLSGDFKEALSKVGIVSVDILRRTIVTLEDYLANGTTNVVYYYGSAKELLPPEILDALNTIEERTTEILKPVGTAVGQIYIAIEVLERSLGFDPSDPVVQFVLLLGTSTTLGITYRVLTYGGYSGDLSPKLTLELLSGSENAVLIDVRPEEMREKDGIPDLRRGARFKYANVSLPKIDGSVKSLLKNGRDLENALIAAVIRNLKIVQDRSKVIVLDADGTRSKGIARSLRRLGAKNAYLVQGGFQSWVKNGLRIKELKTETTLTILNEEAEAILEDIKPTPIQIVGYGVGFVAAIYALFEWEKTLELVGIIGLAQTIYRRVASYEDSDDFKQDVSLLLVPVKIGAEAFSWAAAKLEPSRIGIPTGIPTSPSSSDVQNRVLLAAAKHESQPSDAEESQVTSSESESLANENVDLSEA